MRVRFANLRTVYGIDACGSDPVPAPGRQAPDGGASRWDPVTGELVVVPANEVDAAAAILGTTFAAAVRQAYRNGHDPGWSKMRDEVAAAVRAAAPPGAEVIGQLAATTNLSQSDGAVHVQPSARLRLASPTPDGGSVRVARTLPAAPAEAGMAALAAVAEFAARLATGSTRPCPAGTTATRARGGPDSSCTPVLFTGEAACFLAHEILGHALEWSPATARRLDRLGRLAAGLTVWDDPTAASFVSYRWDSEDVAAEATVLVDAGAVVGHLHSRRSARWAGASPTANGRRQDYGYPPIPRMSMIMVAPGAIPLEDLVRDAVPAATVGEITQARIFPDSGQVQLHTPNLWIGAPADGAPAGRALLYGNLDTLLTHGIRGVSNATTDSAHLCAKSGQRLNVAVRAPDMVVEVGVALQPG